MANDLSDENLYTLIEISYFIITIWGKRVGGYERGEGARAREGRAGVRTQQPKGQTRLLSNGAEDFLLRLPVPQQLSKPRAITHYHQR